MNYLWDDKVNEYKVQLFEINIEVDFMIFYLEELKSNLNLIFNVLENELSEFNPELFYESEFYDSFYFIKYYKEADEQPNLKLKKEIFINAICAAKMHCIEMNFSGRNLTDYNVFKNQCVESIKVIEFQMIALNNPINETINQIDSDNLIINKTIEDEINDFLNSNTLSDIEITQKDNNSINSVEE